MGALPELHSQEQLAAFEVSALPHMKQADQQEIVQRHKSRSGLGKRFRRAADALASLPIPVKRTPVE